VVVRERKFAQDDYELRIHAKPGFLINEVEDTACHVLLIKLKCPDHLDVDVPCYFTMYIPSGRYYYASFDDTEHAVISVGVRNLLLKISKDSEDFYIMRE